MRACMRFVQLCVVMLSSRSLIWLATSVARVVLHLTHQRVCYRLANDVAAAATDINHGDVAVGKPLP